MKKMVAKSSHIDFMFPPPPASTRPLDPLLFPVVDLRGAWGMHTPESKFFQFHAKIFGKILAKSYVGPPLEGWRPHLWGNPGSAIDV